MWLVDVVQKSFGGGDSVWINLFESDDFRTELLWLWVKVLGVIKVARRHDDGAGAYVVDSFDFFFQEREGVFGDDDLDADFWSVALELRESFEEIQVVVPFVDADV